ncbi:MAG TPA: META domain-containing protein, partial [Roseiflexaceae bacterium]|nr:META domain-containing protein [Roseiflexaceae bacterium]
GVASPLAGTTWQLESMGDPAAPTPALAQPPVTLNFDSTKAEIGGNSGCNSYGGGYKVDGAKVTFSQIVGTLMACAEQPAMDQETQYLQALQKVSQFAINGDQLDLTDESGKVLRFRATAKS